MQQYHYLITYRDYLEDVAVFKFAERAHAEAALARPDGDRAGFVVSPEDSLAEIGTPTLLRLYNAWRDEGDREVSKFESRAVGRNRFLVRLETRFRKLPVTEGPAKETAPASAGPVEGATEGETEMTKTATKRKTNGEAKPRKRGGGQPAGKVSEFKPVREGSIRHGILKLLNGRHTAEDIAKEMKSKATTVSSHIFCLKRDCGIGYEISEDGKVTALFPTGKTMKDAVRPAKSE